MPFLCHILLALLHESMTLTVLNINLRIEQLKKQMHDYDESELTETACYQIAAPFNYTLER